MKKHIIFLMVLLLIPSVLAIKTGVVVDVNGNINKGCVEVNNGDSVYGVLKEFDRIDDVKMVFDGIITGTPFLRSINDIEGESLGDNKFSGWNFWVSNNDNSFSEPPELAPGWGMGIGDYKVEKENDVIGINFAVTEYNSDWTVKTKPAKPNYIRYAQLCEKPYVKDIRIEVDGKKDSGSTIGIKPGSKLKVEIELENLYSDEDLRNVYVEGVIDTDDELEEETDEKDLEAGNEKKFKLDFDIPQELDSDDYDLKLKVFSEDKAGLKYEKELKYKLEVDREKHNIIIKSTEFQEKISCQNNFPLVLDFLNIGKEDEAVRLTISNEKLGLFKEDSFNLDQDEKIKRSYNIAGIESGEYTLDIKATYSDTELSESITFKKDCQGPSNKNNEDLKTITSKSINPLSKAENSDNILVTSQDKATQNPEYSIIQSDKKTQEIVPLILLGLFILGCLIAIFLITVILRSTKK